MNILETYRRYDIPPNLVRHQLEVAAVGRYICDHWTGEAVDKNLVTQALLFHDMGNIIKFKRPFLGELEKDALHWEQVQDKYFQKYGRDVHVATCAIIRELGAKQALFVAEKVQEGNFIGYESLPWEVKVCEYADCCVTPQGIVGFETRLTDLMARYHRTNDEEWVAIMRRNATDVERMVNVNLSELSLVNFDEEIGNLRHYSLS